MLELSWRSYVFEWTFSSGLLSVSNFIKALFDPSVDAWVRMPE